MMENSDFFKLLHNLFLLTGFSSLWHIDKWRGKLFRVYCKFAKAVFLIQVFLVNLYFKEAIRDIEHHWRETAFFVASTLTANMSVYKCFLYDSEIMQRLFKEAFLHDSSIQSISHPEIKKAVNKHGKMVYKFFIIYVVIFLCILFGGYIGSAVFYFIGRNCDTRYEKCFRRLAWPTVTFFDVDTQYGWALFSSCAGLTYFGLFILVANITFTAICVFPTFKLHHLQHVLSNFQHYGYLRSKMENTSIREGEYSVVRECVIQHQQIISDFTKLKMYTRKVFFLDFLTRAMQTAPYLVIIMASKHKIDHTLIMTIFCMSWVLFELFMCYWFAQGIVDESINIGICISKSNWYDADIKTQKLFMMIMIRSNKHLALTVGPFYAMQLGIFLRIIKTMYTVVTVFRQSLPDSASGT